MKAHRRWAMVSLGAALVLAGCIPSWAAEVKSAQERLAEPEICVHKRGPDDAPSDAGAIIWAEPLCAEGYRNRALCLQRKGDFEGAIADFSEAIRLAPIEPVIPGYYVSKSDVYICRGQAFAEKGEWDKSLPDYAEALRLSPNNAHACYGRAWVHVNKGDYDEAIADYTDAIRLNPQFTDAYIGRAWVHGVKRGDYDKAIVDYTEAIRLSPELPLAYYGRGWAYTKKGQTQTADRDFARAKGYEQKGSKRT